MIAGATAVFSNTTVIGNGTGLSAGGTTSSHGNNQFNLNGGGVLPPIIGQQ